MLGGNLLFSFQGTCIPTTSQAYDATPGDVLETLVVLRTMAGEFTSVRGVMHDVNYSFGKAFLMADYWFRKSLENIDSAMDQINSMELRLYSVRMLSRLLATHGCRVANSPSPRWHAALESVEEKGECRYDSRFECVVDGEVSSPIGKQWRHQLSDFPFAVGMDGLKVKSRSKKSRESMRSDLSLKAADARADLDAYYEVYPNSRPSVM